MSGITDTQARQDCGWLGDITKMHQIGPYTFVEYVQRGISNSDHNGKTFYSIYVEGHKTSCSADTLDKALLYAIAKRNLVEPNTTNWLSQAAEKLLLVEERQTTP